MSVNVAKLDGELKAAGVPIAGVGFEQDGTLRIDYAPGATPADQARAASVVLAHDPSPTPAQRLLSIPAPPQLLAAISVLLSTAPTITAKAKAQAIVDAHAANVSGLL